jgi:hypothetical protein
MEWAGRSIDMSLADAAIGRMMLHRRRAVMASIIDDFFRRTGTRFLPYLEGRAPSAPTHPADELAIAERAAEVVDAVQGASTPLLFERALLVESDGRLDDAQTDLQRVLAEYPGFVPAAIAAGRVALAAGEPGLAIRSVASVEREVVHTREGAAVLADALRQVGMHEAAGRYDLQALICRGGYDSRGNDCAPVDASGKITNDDRMPQIFYFESQPDGNIICNGRGIYYRVNPILSRMLLAFMPGQTIATFRSLGPGHNPTQIRAPQETLEAVAARLRLLLHDQPVLAVVAQWLRKVSAALWPLLRRIFMALLFGAAKILRGVAVFVYRMYRRLPVPARATTNRYSLNQARVLLQRYRHLIVKGALSEITGQGARGLESGIVRTGLSEISGQGARGLARVRYESGIARIFGLQMSAGDGAVGHARGLPHPTAKRGKLAASLDGAASGIGALRVPEPGTLPPAAEEVLCRLLGAAAANMRRPPSPLC